MYLPLHEGGAGAGPGRVLARVPFRGVYAVTGALPLGAFALCVLLTLWKDFERANRTHCDVRNVLPSISAAVGNYAPQVYIWQAAVALHAPGRLLTLCLRLRHYERAVLRALRPLVRLAVLLNAAENLALLGLTFWTSQDYYSYHEVCFKTFIGTSILYMLIVCVLLTRYRRRSSLSVTEQRSLVLKRRLFITNVVAFACAAYFFLRHNEYCEPYVYSMFGFSEYIVVVSNMAFHLTTIYDFHRQSVVFTTSGIFLQ